MKIKNISFEKLVIPMNCEFHVAFGVISSSTSVIVKITADSGLAGYGEAAPFPFVTGENCEMVLHTQALFRQALVGMDAMNIEGIHAAMDGMKIARSGAADMLNIKLMKCGGLYPAMQINAIAEAVGMSSIVGCMMETKIVITDGLSLVAPKKNITDADCDSFMFCRDPEMGMPGGYTVEGNLFTLSQEPGLGLSMNF